MVPGVYPAYLTYDAYLANRRTLQDNLYNFARKGGGAPREGLHFWLGWSSVAVAAGAWR